MSEMIERVARVLSETELGPGMWDIPIPRLDHVLREKWRIRARAAIAAMREPTREMRDALSATDKQWLELNSQAVWQTYIDAALKD